MVAVSSVTPTAILQGVAVVQNCTFVTGSALAGA